MPGHPDPQQLTTLAANLRLWATELGFQQLGITDIELAKHEDYLNRWLANHYQGEMSYMQEHGSKRSHPEQLIPGTVRVISVRMDYLPSEEDPAHLLTQSGRAYISRYALGRDYHKLMRKRLARLADRLSDAISGYQYRAFVDSAPVLERALAEKAGLGWIGKNNLLINSKAGSWFFLGEIYTDLPLPVDPPHGSSHCGSCRACLDICPTQAFVGPNQLDARRCISYLTIELRGSIPEELRRPIGNRIFGCDDCQLVCPWNKFARPSNESDFKPRHNLDDTELLNLMQWSEEEFLARTEGSPIRRTGYESWLRNIAVALGNAAYQPRIMAALQEKLSHPSAVVREHVLWALDEQHAKASLIKTGIE